MQSPKLPAANDSRRAYDPHGIQQTSTSPHTPQPTWLQGINGYAPDVGLYTILPLQIVYGVLYTKGGSGEGLTLRSSRAIPLQQCRHYRWGGKYDEDWLVHKSVKVNEYLVKANPHTLQPTWLQDINGHAPDDTPAICTLPNAHIHIPKSHTSKALLQYRQYD